MDCPGSAGGARTENRDPKDGSGAFDEASGLAGGYNFSTITHVVRPFCEKATGMIVGKARGAASSSSRIETRCRPGLMRP